MIQYSSPLLPSLLLLLLILTRLYRGTSIKEASKPSPQVFLKVSKKKTLLLLLEFNRSIRSIRPASIKLQVHEAVLPMAWCWYWCLFGSLPVCVSLSARHNHFHQLPSFTIFAFSMIYLPSLYFWDSSNACSYFQPRTCWQQEQ